MFALAFIACMGEDCRAFGSNQVFQDLESCQVDYQEGALRWLSTRHPNAVVDKAVCIDMDTLKVTVLE